MTCVEKRLLFTHPIRTQQTQLPLRPLFDASGRRESNFKYLFGFFFFRSRSCFVLCYFVCFNRNSKNGVKQYFGLFKLIRSCIVRHMHLSYVIKRMNGAITF